MKIQRYYVPSKLKKTVNLVPLVRLDHTGRFLFFCGVCADLLVVPDEFCIPPQINFTRENWEFGSVTNTEAGLLA